MKLRKQWKIIRMILIQIIFKAKLQTSDQQHIFIHGPLSQWSMFILYFFEKINFDSSFSWKVLIKLKKKTVSKWISYHSKSIKSFNKEYKLFIILLLKKYQNNLCLNSNKTKNQNYSMAQSTKRRVWLVWQTLFPRITAKPS